MPKRPVRRFPDPIPKEIADIPLARVDEVSPEPQGATESVLENVEEGPPAPSLALMGKAALEAKALQTVFAEHYQPISVAAVVGVVTAFDVSPDNKPGKSTFNDGEWDGLLNRVARHWTGEIQDLRDEGYFRLLIEPRKGRVVPGGGVAPYQVLITKGT